VERLAFPVLESLLAVVAWAPPLEQARLLEPEEPV
jgi:hypothetical protein